MFSSNWAGAKSKATAHQVSPSLGRIFGPWRVLAEAGYSYSSSTYPIVHDNYGIPEGPRFPFHPLPGHNFMEIPVTSIRVFGRNWPCGGGGYFRLLPYAVSEMALARVNREGRSCVFYVHPWEVDPGPAANFGGTIKVTAPALHEFGQGAAATRAAIEII